MYLILIIPLVVSVLSFVIKKSMRTMSLIVLASSLIELIFVFCIVLEVFANGPRTISSYFAIDYLGAIVLLIIGTVGCAVQWYSIGYLKSEMAKKIIGFNRVRQYFVLTNLFIFAMLFSAVTTNPILLWIAIEATTLSTAFLISFYNKPTALEAAWKYLIINSVGLLLAFFGTLLFSYPALNSGHTILINWNILLANAGTIDPFIAKVAFIFILIGYGTKMGLVPMHTWLPDAHSKAPAPVSSLLSGVLLNVAFLAILRFKVLSDVMVGPKFSQDLLIAFGLLSMLVAAFIILVQKNYKRLLAYSSIEHMGIIALGFGFGGVGAFAALLHMMYHSLAKSILFLSAGNIFLKYSSTKIVNIRGMLRVLPTTSIVLIIGFLAITGVPPFGIFLTEFSILSAGITAHPLVVVLALFAMALVFIGFLMHVISMIFGEKEESIAQGEASGTIAPIVVLVIIFITLSVYIPPALHDAIGNVAGIMPL